MPQNNIKGIFMKKIFSFAFAISSSIVLAAPPVTINTFSPNTAISSSAVNTNFNNLKNAVDVFQASNAGIYIFPADGTAGQILSTNGSGSLSWINPAGGG